MVELESSTLALKTAEAILLCKGEISLEEIRSIPFLEDINHAELIASYLKAKFKIEDMPLRRRGAGNDWDELMVLIS